MSFPLDLTVYNQIPGSVADGSKFDNMIASIQAALNLLGAAVFNVKDYGAVGNGVTDDTTAINTAETARNAANGVLFFPAGSYVYNGTGINATQPRVIGAGPGATTIILGATSRFINVTTALSRLLVTGITFSGGVDVIRSTFTGANVIDYLVVEDCEFAAYTKAAISGNSSDMPYVKINRCSFNGANYTTTIGVALPGLTDACAITDCDFQANRVHVKLRQGGNNAYIRNCDFLRLSASAGLPRVDVWVVPQTTSVNAGSGLVVESCKFGNELYESTDYKILYADEDTAAGSDNGTYFPKLSADSTGYVVGHRFTNNNYVGISTATPIVYSTTPNLHGNHYGPLLVGSGTFSYIVQFRTAPTADRNNTDNLVGPLHGTQIATETLPAPAVSNGNGVFQVVDSNGLLETAPTVPLGRPGASDPAGYVGLLTTKIRSFSTVTASLANVTDSLGGIDASELSITTTGIVYGQLVMGSVTVGNPVWVEFDVKVGSSSPLSAVQAYLTTESGAFHWRRTVTVPAAGWQRFRFLYVPRTAAGQTDIAFASPTAATGKVQIGRVRVYHAREPQNDGAYPIASGTNRILSGSGVPDAGLGSNGDFYFRIDTPGTANQRLYVKSAGAWTGIL